MAESSQQLAMSTTLTRSTAMPSFRRLRSNSLNSVRLRRVFDLFDGDGDGEITVAELRLALDRLGLGVDPADLDELSSMVASYIRPGRAGLEFSDFEAFHRAIGDALFGNCDAGDAEEENDMREAFRVFDENGDGYISATELQAVLQKLGLLDGRSIEGVRQMIAAVDRDRDGRVNFAEFKNMMRSIEVPHKALEIWDLEVIPVNSQAAASSKFVPELENAFICHLHDHWFCIRKVNGEWYNFNSLLPAPEHLSQFYFSAYIDSLKDSGWSIFLVRGNFPRDCPIPHDSSTGFVEWLTPHDAESITKSCAQLEASSQEASLTELGRLSEQEDADLNAAIQASLMDTTGFHSKPSTVDAGHAIVDSAAINATSDLPNNGSDSDEPTIDVNNVTSIAETQKPQTD